MQVVIIKCRVAASSEVSQFYQKLCPEIELNWISASDLNVSQLNPPSPYHFTLLAASSAANN